MPHINLPPGNLFGPPFFPKNKCPLGGRRTLLPRKISVSPLPWLDPKGIIPKKKGHWGPSPNLGFPGAQAPIIQRKGPKLESLTQPNLEKKNVFPKRAFQTNNPRPPGKFFLKKPGGLFSNPNNPRNSRNSFPPLKNSLGETGTLANKPLGRLKIFPPNCAEMGKNGPKWPLKAQ